MASAVDVIKNFKGDTSGVKEFQKKSVRDLGYKYYVEKKNKLLLADEVGMGKTYVCRGLVELGHLISGENGSFTVIYIAPNDNVAKQNLRELCDGFVNSDSKKKVFKNERLSALKIKKDGKKIKKDGKYNILSFSAGMFFSEEKGTTGTVKERAEICKTLIRAFLTLYKNESDRESAEKYENFFEMMISALANSSQNGDECRYEYFLGKDVLSDKLIGFRNQYTELWKNSLESGLLDILDIKEAKFVFQQIQNEFGQYIDTINSVVEYIENKSSLSINKFIEEMYYPKNETMEKKVFSVHMELKDGDFLEDDKKKNIAREFVIPLLIPYYVNDYQEYNKIVSSFFGKLRYIINLNNYRKLSPDLIILDEFHKYFSGAVRSKLETYLNIGKDYDKEAKVLLMSATPYKMNLKSVNIMSEKLDEYDVDDTDEGRKETSKRKIKDKDDENCFSGYQDVYNFLSGSDSKKISELFADTVMTLKNMSEKSADKAAFLELWNKCRSNKAEMQSLLEQYVVRTERSTLLKSVDSKFELISEANTDFTKEEMFYDCEMVSSLHKGGVGINNALLYTKMSPYPMSFSEGYTSIGFPETVSEKSIREFEEYLNRFDSKCFWDGRAIPDCYRLRMLMKKFGWNTEETLSPVTKALWIPSAKSDGLKGFWADIKNVSKFLVFARHIMTIKSVSAILSVQSELTGAQPMPDEYFDELRNGIDEAKNTADDARKGIPYACFYQGIIRGIQKDIEKLSDVDLNNLKKTARDCTKLFFDYLKEHKMVLANAEVTDADSLFTYCSDGDLCGVIEEYVFVLTKGDFKDDVWDRLKSMCDVFDVRNTGEISYYCKENDGCKKYNVKCGIANLFSEQNGDKDYIIRAFNSPFYPFILMTTPIAQEGLNFQYYSHNTFHWRTPVSPIDYEQREGRVNRYRNHAVRKSVVSKAAEFGLGWNDVVNLSWKELFDKAAEYSNKNECDHGGLNPDWVTDGGNNTSGYLKSYIIVHPESRELNVERILKDAINNYRVSLGYGISNDIVTKIKEQAERLGINDCKFEEILIDLSPKEI